MSGVDNTYMVKRIGSEINSTISVYHNHSKSCRQCRHPKGLYEARTPMHQRCPDGITLTTQLMAQLYLRAEYEPKGTFRVEFKEGWDEIRELIEVICHNKQGQYTTKVIDLKRARPATPEPMMIESSRGSDWEDDMRRRGMKPTPSPEFINAVPVNVPRSSHPARSSGFLEVYPDPAHAANAYPSPSSSPAGSFTSQKSVKFAPRVQVREYAD